MGVLIDTSVLVGFERGQLDLERVTEERLRHRPDEPFYLSVITVSELLHGVHRAQNRVQRARRSAFVEGVKIGSSSRADSVSPSGRGMPQTVPLWQYSFQPDPAR